MPQDAARYQPMETYPLRHWRGELSLGTSVFVNGVLVGALLLLLFAGKEPFWSARPGAWAGLALFVAMWLSVPVILTWQLVGIWRAAARYMSGGGRRFWAVGARASALFGLVFSALLLLSSGLVQVVAHVRGVAGIMDIRPATMWHAKAWNKIVLSGDIGPGMAEELEALLAAAPEISAIELNSLGGHIPTAFKIQKLIHSRGLDTQVRHDCASACTLVFLGGWDRLVDGRARIGFHQSAAPGMRRGMSDAINTMIVGEVIAMGVAPDFARHAYLSPADGVLVPTLPELVAAGVATEIVHHRFGAAGLTEDTGPAAVETALQAQPELAVLARAEPDRFGALVDMFSRALQAGLPEDRLEDLLHDPFEQVMPAYLRFLPDEGLVSEGALQLLRVAALADTDADACARYVRSWRLAPEIAALLPRALMTVREEIATAAMTAGLDGGRPRPTAPWQDRTAVGGPAIGGSAIGGSAAACRDAERLLRDILARPPAEAGPLLFALLGG